VTLQKDQPKPPQNRTQKIVMYSVFGVAIVGAVVSIVLAIVNGVRLF